MLILNASLAPAGSAADRRVIHTPATLGLRLRDRHRELTPGWDVAETRTRPSPGIVCRAPAGADDYHVVAIDQQTQSASFA